MSHPSLPVARGAERIEHQLQRSLIMPRPVEAIRTILRALDCAEQAMREPAANSDPSPPRPVSWSLSWTTRARALAELGTDR
jgi:hypothetical protein